MRRLIGAVRVAILCAVVLPAVAIAVLAADRRHETRRAAEALLARRVDLVAEHVGRVIEIQEVILDQIDLVTRGMSWAEIAGRREVSLLLKDFAEQREHIASVWIADPGGEIRAASLPWRAGLRIDDRDFFIAQRAQDRGVFIGEAFVGRTTGVRSFGVSRRRTTADGSFNGTIHVAVAAGYFEAFFAGVPGERQVVALVRADGAVLARSPPAPDPIRLTEASPLMQRIAAAEHGVFWGRSTIDGMERLYAFTRVGTYPLYAGFGVDASAVFAEWRAETLRYAVMTAALVLLLVAAGFGLMMLARRAEAAALRAVAEAERNVAAQRTIDALERQNAVSRVVAGVAHEFNNLLTPILMGAEALREQARDAGQREMLASMAAGAERGARLVADLMSHIQNQFLRLETVALRPLVAATLARFGADLPPGIAVALEAEDGLPPVSADRRQLELALMHLLENAKTAMPRGGIITVRLARPADAPDRGQVVLAVEDDGCGMTPEVLAKAREPFFSTAANRERPGLGLAMVSGFLGQIGGTFAIESTPGLGTRVELRLPVAPG